MYFHKELEINVRVDKLHKYNIPGLLQQMVKYLIHQFQEENQFLSHSEK